MIRQLMYVILFSAILIMNSMAQTVDISKKPEPLAGKEFKFPAYQEDKLSNGIKVFLIEDNEQPTFSFSLMIPGGSAYDGDKPGLAEVTAAMLTKGAGKLTAQQIAEKLDGVGASLDVEAYPDYFIVSGSCIVKHIPTLLEVLSDVVLNPTFPKEELEKLKPRIIASIKQEKSRGSSLASALTKKILYGENHPYGKRKTEATIESLTIDDIKIFYNKYFKPDWASLAVTGDVNLKEVKKIFDKALGNWKKGNLPPLNMPPIKPEPLGVYFVNRPASVQSSIVLSTITIPYKHPDYEALDIAASIIGSGFAGRLFRTLRETYSYTYTPFGYQTSAKFENRFSCGAEVRNAVTDSAIDVIKEQLLLLANEPPSDEELNRIVKYRVGTYLMSFENSEFVANLIQKAYFNSIPLETLKDYPKRIQSLTPYDIKKVAKKYMHPDKAYIVVVGSPEVRSKLEKFGKIFDFDTDLNPQTGEKAKVEQISVDPNELLSKYFQARGGKDAVSQLESFTRLGKATLDFQGQKLEGVSTEKFKKGQMKYQQIDFGMFSSEIWLNPNGAWTKAQGNLEKLEPREQDKLIFDFAITFDFDLLTKYFKANVIGKQGDFILVKFKSRNGFEATTYFNATSYLLESIETTEETPQGVIPVTTKFSDWGKVNNLLFPMASKTTNPMFSVEVKFEYQLDTPFDDSSFEPPK